jgi:hypothetical protein
MKERIENVSTFVLIVELTGGCLSFVISILPGQEKIPGRRGISVNQVVIEQSESGLV